MTINYPFVCTSLAEPRVQVFLDSARAGGPAMGGLRALAACKTHPRCASHMTRRNALRPTGCMLLQLAAASDHKSVTWMARQN